jgi:hypothetical protein
MNRRKKMLLVIDPSVIQHAAAAGGEMCRACLNIIAKNTKIKIARHARWATESSVTHNFNRDSVITNWQRLVFVSGRFVAVKDTPANTFGCLIEHADSGHTYILTMATQADNAVVYCEALSAACARFSNINHPVFSTIAWKPTHNQDTLDWLSNAQ